MQIVKENIIANDVHRNGVHRNGSQLSRNCVHDLHEFGYLLFLVQIQIEEGTPISVSWNEAVQENERQKELYLDDGLCIGLQFDRS